MFSTTSFDRLMTMLGMFCRDELRREGIGAVLHETADNDREYLARHDVLPEWWSRLSGRGRFDELAVRVRDYPGPLPANVQENRAAFDELKTILKEVELDTERPEPKIWGRLEVLRKQIQDGAKVPMGEVVKAKAGRKKSTSEKPARIKIIAFLTKHHEYANGSLLNQTPIGANELHRDTPVSKGAASKFFKDEFGGHENYKKACMDSGTLIVALKALNNEYTPKLLFENAKPQVDAPDE